MASVETSTQASKTTVNQPNFVPQTGTGLINESTQGSMKASLSFAAGCASGALARLVTNSPRDLASQLQNSGVGLRDLPSLASRFKTIKNLTSCTLGTATQYAVTYGLKEWLKSPDDSSAMKLAKDGLSAVAGGIAIHPSTIAFYHMDSDPRLSGRQNLYKIVSQSPKDLYRGLGPRLLTSSSQWMTFFGMKDALQSQGFSEEWSRGAASLGGVLISTPFYQAYAHQCRNGGTIAQSFSQVGKMMQNKPATTALFAFAAAGEMYFGDTLQNWFLAFLNKK